jgi:hypothetical protein
MSRVEPKDDRRDARREAEPDPRRQPVDRKPSQAEGDEETVEEALKRQQ